MQVVISIPKEKYDVIKSDLYNTFPNEMKEWGLEAIRTGTPLPKGHGDLIDRKKLQNSIDDKDLISPKDIINIQTLRKWINNQNPIIEADKVEKEEV